MACPAYSLHRYPPLQVFPSDTRTHCQGDHLGTVIDSNNPSVRNLFLPVLLPVGRCLCHRVAGALLAACVLAVIAILVGAKRRLAAMAGPINPYANLLLDSFSIRIDGWCPFSNFQCQAILSEQGASFLFLDSVTGSSGFRQSRIGKLCARLDVSDGLLDGGRNRWCSSSGRGCICRSRGGVLGSRCLCCFLRITFAKSEKISRFGQTHSLYTYPVTCSGIGMPAAAEVAVGRSS